MPQTFKISGWGQYIALGCVRVEVLRAETRKSKDYEEQMHFSQHITGPFPFRVLAFLLREGRKV